MSCVLGKLYNKDALLEYLLDHAAYGDGDEICGHIKSLKVRLNYMASLYAALFNAIVGCENLEIDA